MAEFVDGAAYLASSPYPLQQPFKNNLYLHEIVDRPATLEEKNQICCFYCKKNPPWSSLAS